MLSEGLNGLPVLRVVCSPLSKGYTESQCKILIGIPVGMQEYNHDSPFFSLSMIILSSKMLASNTLQEFAFKGKPQNKPYPNSLRYLLQTYIIAKN